jgi:hypothetical protein
MLAPLLRCHTPDQFQLLTALRDKNGLEGDFTRFAKFWRPEAKYRNLQMKCDVDVGHPLWEK